MRTLLITGPGGAGSSTIAAATAQSAADSGLRVVLLTAAAPPLAGLDDVVRVEVVDAQHVLESAWSQYAAELAALAPALTLPPGSSVVPVPGATEVAVLLALIRSAAAGDVDLVVIDAGPLPAATALLALPDALRWWLAQLAPTRLRVLAMMRALSTRGRLGATGTAHAAVTALEGLLAQVPTDPAVHLVLRPDPGADDVARTAATRLGLLGHQIASVTLSRVLPVGVGDWAAGRTRQQDGVRAALTGAGLQVREIAEAAGAIRDLDALRALRADLPTSTADALPSATAHREDEHWVLPVPLPFAARGTVGLTRWGDDLILDVAGLRRSVPLDPLLRRCTVTSGSLVDPGTAQATLVVRCTPDPAQWPAGLLSTEGSPA